MSRLSYNVSFFVRLKESCAEWIRKCCCYPCSLFAQTCWSLGGGKKASSLRPLTDATGTPFMHLSRQTLTVFVASVKPNLSMSISSSLKTPSSRRLGVTKRSSGQSDDAL